MQRSWESGTGGPGPEIEMTGGSFLGRRRPSMGCTAWEWVLRIFPSQFKAILAAASRCLNLKQLFVEDIRWKKDTKADKSGFKQRNFLFYCDLELVGVLMNNIHICIVSHCNVQDANINSTHDWNTVLGFFFHVPVAAVILFATYTSSKVFLNYAIYTFICSCFPFEVTVGIT